MKTTILPASLTAAEMVIARSHCQAVEKDLARFSNKRFMALGVDVQTYFPSQVSKCHSDAEHG